MSQKDEDEVGTTVKPTHPAIPAGLEARWPGGPVRVTLTKRETDLILAGGITAIGLFAEHMKVKNAELRLQGYGQFADRMDEAVDVARKAMVRELKAGKKLAESAEVKA
jgi:hypothetical protein